MLIISSWFTDDNATKRDAVKRANKDKTPGRCAFCGATGMSKEHIWSDWLKEVLPPTSSHHSQTRTTTAFVGNVALLIPSMPTQHRGAVTQRKIRKFCDICNNGWMRRERSAKGARRRSWEKKFPESLLCAFQGTR